VGLGQPRFDREIGKAVHDISNRRAVAPLTLRRGPRGGSETWRKSRMRSL
jgi:hypothetical protein